MTTEFSELVKALLFFDPVRINSETLSVMLKVLVVVASSLSGLEKGLGNFVKSSPEAKEPMGEEPNILLLRLSRPSDVGRKASLLRNVTQGLG